MTPRSIRRAAERKARKLARRSEKAIRAGSVSDFGCEPLAATPEPPPSPAYPAGPDSNSRAASTGELSTVETGLPGRSILLPSEDAEHYRQHVRRFFADYKPAGDQERELVQRLADTAWRLLRIPALEAGLFALGRIQFQDMFQDRDPALRVALIDSQSLVAFQKQFHDLHLQESRLLRWLDKDRKELAELQSRRHAGQPAQLASNFQTPAVPHASACSGELQFTVLDGTLEPFSSATPAHYTPDRQNQATGLTAES